VQNINEPPIKMIKKVNKPTNQKELKHQQQQKTSTRIMKTSTNHPTRRIKISTKYTTNRIKTSTNHSSKRIKTSTHHSI
jgi:hypothetical protein